MDDGGAGGTGGDEVAADGPEDMLGACTDQAFNLVLLAEDEPRLLGRSVVTDATYFYPEGTYDASADREMSTSREQGAPAPAPTAQNRTLPLPRSRDVRRSSGSRALCQRRVACGRSFGGCRRRAGPGAVYRLRRGGLRTCSP